MSVKAKLWSGVTLVVILGAVGVGVWYYVAHKTAALPVSDSQGKILGQVGDYRVHQADIDPLALDAKTYGKSTSDLVHLLLDVKLYSLAATDLHISVTDADVTASLAADNLAAATSSSRYIRLSRQRDLLETGLSHALQVSAQGKFIIAHYDQHFPNPNLPVPDGYTAAVQAADKTYALNLINSLESKLSAKTISFDQAIASELADPIIGQVGAPAMIQSGSFDTTDTQSVSYTVISQPDIASAIRSLKLGQISQPLTGTVAFPTPASRYGTPVPGLSLIVTVTARSDGNSKYSTLSALTDAYKVKYNYRTAS